VRVVNVVDLFTIASPHEHPHGMPADLFADLFTPETHVVFAFHGYANVVHALLHGRTHAERFHVRGYAEEGTTTTPFDMVVLNGMSRYHIAIAALQRARRPPPQASRLVDECEEMLRKHHAYVRAELQDLPEIRNWTFS